MIPGRAQRQGVPPRRRPGTSVRSRGAWFPGTLLSCVLLSGVMNFALPLRAGSTEPFAGVPPTPATATAVPTVHDVVFPPGLTFSRTELLPWLDLQPRRRRGESTFTMARWRADLRRLESFYRQEGFDRAEVRGLVEAREDGAVVLHVGVEEGPRWHWIRCGLELRPSRAALDGRLRELLPKPGEPARWRLLPYLRERVMSVVAEDGHHDAHVEFRVRRDASDRLAELVVVVEAGPRTRAEGVEIRGLDKTRPAVIAREILVRDGAPLLPRDLRKSEQRLRALGIFREVRVEPAPVSHRPGFRAVRVLVDEERAGRFGSGFGYGSIDRLHFEASLEQGNLAGRAVRVATTGILGQERRRFETGAFVPWIVGRRVGLRLTAAYEKQFPARYEVERLGAEASIVREIDDRWKLEFGYVAERVQLLSSESVGIGAREDAIRVGRLGVALSRDTRDQLVGPTRGSYLRISQDWVSPRLGSSEDFTRLKAQVWGHAHLRRMVFGHVRFLFGLLRSHDAGNEIPLPERFFAGGTEDLRGFPGDGIGPADALGAPVGGRVLVLAGAELEHRVYRGLGLAAFLDVGQLEDREEELRLGRLSVGAGAGLRLRSRLGHLRADAGFPLTERFAEAPRFHFSTGTTFF